jgi:hypothetical protein
MLAAMAQELKREVETAEYRKVDVLINEYLRLKNFLESVFPDARGLLPERPSLSSFEDVRYAINQLVNYANAKAMPLFLELLNILQRVGALIENPLSPLLPILHEWGISVNWAVGAVALALIEVMVNKKLEELNMSTSGDFRTRYNRLISIARTKGIQLPDLLADPFYQARNKLLNGGKEPTPEELKLIFDYLYTLSESLKKIN